MPPVSIVTAVLGPTNTGKTHLAVERMLAHGGGMIGLPLRLLAREIFERVRARAGDQHVALVTGEEKIIPASPRYWVATVEAMPPDVVVPFLAIDECQLCADFERGHIFTDRVLNRRGSEETMLLGAATMKPILEKLLPRVNFVARPRFSKLTYAGVKKISRLPRRSAIVAFSADMVYTIAELIRRQNGGAAVVMGALSPRTRNAQVALYQSGDVDYIVATDAIGMGLNMAVDHVAFGATRKFDGFQFRELNPSELAQIAGRAGRHLNDGTFGATGEVDGFDEDVIDRLENHSFDNVRMLQWRNPDLDFGSIERLQRSLSMFPRSEGLTRAQPGADVIALEAVARDSNVLALAQGRAAVELLWSACQIPDYRNISPTEHAHLVSRLFTDLASPAGYIDEDWFARQLTHCENLEGDLDTLSNRISHVRTWTFIANRGDWLKAPHFWQQRAREIEDRLSDALHERLTQRFIDRRTSVLMRRLAQKEELMASMEDDGSIRVEGEHVGHIKGFIFIPDGASSGQEQRTLQAAALQAVASEMQARAMAAAASPDTDLKLDRHGRIIWNGAEIAQAEAGDSLLQPRLRLLASDLLQGQAREDLQNRLQKFVTRHVSSLLEPLLKLSEAEQLQGMARGIAFRIVESLGMLPRETVAEDVKSLSQDDRAALRQFGVRFGAFHIFIPLLLKPAATDLRLLLWALHGRKLDISQLPEPPGQGLTSAAFDRSTPVGFYGVCGYRICGPRVVRIDMLERLADLIRDRVFWKPRIDAEQRPAGSVEGGGFTVVPDMMSLVGCSGEEFKAILRSLGFRMQAKKVPNPALAAPVATAAETGPTPAVSEAEQHSPPEAVTEENAPVEKTALVEETAPMETGTAPAVETPPAEIELEIWWPKDTGPFRHRAQPSAKPSRRPDSKTAGTGAREEKGDRGKPRKGKPSGKRPEQPAQRRPEKPIDPDSPFAVLGALKAQLAGSKN
jgi:ATP-dependent RNA helicase SUPV3L1/SUV3